jgi:hypothetical protein
MKALLALLLAAPPALAENLHISDGSDDPPKLWIAINVWRLEKLPPAGRSGPWTRS